MDTPDEDQDTPSNGDDIQSGSSSEDLSFEEIRRTFNRTLQFMSLVPKQPTEQVLDQLNLDGVANYIKSEKCKNIVTMAGAGISTSAGIPDFRSPGSGLYDNLQKYNLPYPQAIFEMNYFVENPQPFFVLAKELYPGSFKPTVGHYFIKLLEQKGLLLRHYTQNIDTLERVAGINAEKLVEAHGTFFTSHCLACRHMYTLQWMKEKIFSDTLPKCDICDGVVKPDIVFFGESLPSDFFDKSIEDLPHCDLLIIMGSSLVVQPFASLKDRVPPNCPRLLINREKVGEGDLAMTLLGIGCPLNFDPETNKRDVFWEGSCDDGCMLLAEKLGWGDELRDIVKQGNEMIEKENAEGPAKKLSSTEHACIFGNSSTDTSSSKYSDIYSPSSSSDVHMQPSFSEFDTSVNGNSGESGSQTNPDLHADSQNMQL